MVYCPNCGEVVDHHWNFCPFCKIDLQFELFDTKSTITPVQELNQPLEKKNIPIDSGDPSEEKSISISSKSQVDQSSREINFPTISNIPSKHMVKKKKTSINPQLNHSDKYYNPNIPKYQSYRTSEMKRRLKVDIDPPQIEYLLLFSIPFIFILLFSVPIRYFMMEFSYFISSLLVITIFMKLALPYKDADNIEIEQVFLTSSLMMLTSFLLYWSLIVTPVLTIVFLIIIFVISRKVIYVRHEINSLIIPFIALIIQLILAGILGTLYGIPLIILF